MKTLKINTAIFTIVLALVLFVNYAFTGKLKMEKSNESNGVNYSATYGYVFHKSSYTKNKTAYVSTIIYQKADCDVSKAWEGARMGFGRYLSNNYSIQPTYDIANIEYWTGSEYGFLTKEKAEESLEKHIKYEKSIGSTVVNTTYSYSCY